MCLFRNVVPSPPDKETNILLEDMEVNNKGFLTRSFITHNKTGPNKRKNIMNIQLARPNHKKDSLAIENTLETSEKEVISEILGTVCVSTAD